MLEEGDAPEMQTGRSGKLPIETAVVSWLVKGCLQAFHGFVIVADLIVA